MKMRILLTLLLAIFITGCGVDDVIETAKAASVKNSDLRNMTDEEFCNYTSWKFNFGGSKDLAVHREAVRRKLYERTGRKCGLNDTYITALERNNASSGGEKSLFNSTKPSRVVYEQALAICEPRAKLAGEQNRSSHVAKKDNFYASCRKNVFGNFECDGESYQGGGAARGILNAMDKSALYSSAYKATFDSCMAEYGYY